MLNLFILGGESGSADTARDPRGFAIKFYSEDGNWDLVGNNTPIFFIRDPILFPSFIHTQKRNPQTHLKVFITNTIQCILVQKLLYFCIPNSIVASCIVFK